MSFYQVMLHSQQPHIITANICFCLMVTRAKLRVAHIWLCDSTRGMRALQVCSTHLSSHPRTLAEESVTSGTCRKRVRLALLFPGLPPHQVSAGCRLPVLNPHLPPESPFLKLCSLAPALLLFLDPSCTGSSTILGFPSSFPNFGNRFFY